MQRRVLGDTGLSVPVLSFGASSLGEEFVPIDLEDGFRAVRTALDGGMDLLDTAPYYGRGMSEVMLGLALLCGCQSGPRKMGEPMFVGVPA